jgi:hypothetical protein
MLTFHVKTTLFITHYTLNMMNETAKTAVQFVIFCCWPAVNKALSPHDLCIILVQLLLEHRVQLIHTNVDGETKHKIYTEHNSV